MAEEQKGLSPTPTEPVKPEAPQPPARKSSKDLIDQGIAPALPKGNDKQGQPKDGEPDGVESFTNIDPKTLSPELKSIYNSMLTDYKQKMEKVSEQGKITPETREKILKDTLDNLTDEEFANASQHPVFVNRLMSYLNRNGREVNGQSAQAEAEPDPDLELADPVTKRLYEQNQHLIKTIDELKTRVDQSDVQSRNAAIQAEDARLSEKYKGVYDPSMINGFLNNVKSGQTTLTRELLFKAMDYDSAVKRAFRYGQDEQYQERPNRDSSSMLAGIQPGGTVDAFEPIRPNKGENRLSHMTRLWEQAKQEIATGRRSPYVKQ